MVPAINYLAVLAALIASMVIGAVFYHRAVLGRTWMRLVGHSDDTVQGGSPLAYPIVVVASFLTAWALAGATYLAYKFYEGSFLLSALVTGWILWLSFTVARMVGGWTSASLRSLTARTSHPSQGKARCPAEDGVPP